MGQRKVLTMNVFSVLSCTNFIKAPYAKKPRKRHQLRKTTLKKNDTIHCVLHDKVNMLFGSGSFLKHGAVYDTISGRVTKALSNRLVVFRLFLTVYCGLGVPAM